MRGLINITLFFLASNIGAQNFYTIEEIDPTTEVGIKQILVLTNEGYENLFVNVSIGDWSGAVSYTHLTLPTTPYV